MDPTKLCSLYLVNSSALQSKILECHSIFTNGCIESKEGIKFIYSHVVLVNLINLKELQSKKYITKWVTSMVKLITNNIVTSTITLLTIITKKQG